MQTTKLTGLNRNSRQQLGQKKKGNNSYNTIIKLVCRLKIITINRPKDISLLNEHITYTYVKLSRTQGISLGLLVVQGNAYGYIADLWR